jgi:hypothetical protein
MGREERLEARQVGELYEQARTPRVCDKRRRRYESRNNSRTSKTDRRRRVERLRGGEG